MNNSKRVGFKRLICKKKKFAAALQKNCELMWVAAYMGIVLKIQNNQLL